MAKGDAADIDLAVSSALAAWTDRRWRGLAPRARMDILLRFADQVEQQADELALLETLDMGKPISDVLNIDLPEVLRTIRYFAECIDKIEGAVTHTAPGSLHMIVHEPLGVVGAISPWNYPMLMAIWKVAPALAAGNCVVLKPSEQAPLSCLRLAQLFVEAGGPAGVFNVVNGLGPEAGKALALHPDVAKLTFTGSTAVGKLLLGYAGQSNMKRVALETGGKSPQIFFDDLYDLDAAVDRAIGGIYDNAGQVCNAGSRLLVQRGIHDAFVARFVARSGRSSTGPVTRSTRPPRWGRWSAPRTGARCWRHVRRAAARGAQLAWAAPTAHCRRWRLRRADPVHRHRRHRWRSTAKRCSARSPALMVFDTERGGHGPGQRFGLRPGRRRLDRRPEQGAPLVGALEAGVVWVNCFGDGDMTQPFGGYKQSGNSRDKHMDSLLSYTQGKSAWFASAPEARLGAQAPDTPAAFSRRTGSCVPWRWCCNVCARRRGRP